MNREVKAEGREERSPGGKLREGQRGRCRRGPGSWWESRCRRKAWSGDPSQGCGGLSGGH